LASSIFHDQWIVAFANIASEVHIWGTFALGRVIWINGWNIWAWLATESTEWSVGLFIIWVLATTFIWTFVNEAFCLAI
jgi:hypothetical protein